MVASMTTAQLATRCRELRAKLGLQRLVVTVSGTPGSGKTTQATSVADYLNRFTSEKALAVSMDGFHYSRAQLDLFEDAESAHKFRGAPFTIDAQGVYDLAATLHDCNRRIEVPTFDHALKDPIHGDCVIEPDVTVVIFEGLYLHLDYPPWQGITDFSDDTWQVTVEPAVARDRLAARHLASGIVETLEDGYARADFNDLKNGRHILENCKAPALYLPS